MLKIRSAQIPRLEEALMSDFLDRMARHVQSYFPREAATVDGLDTRERIMAATTCAFQYGMSTERELCFFITLDYIFGHDFASNPALSWFTVALCSRIDSSASERVLQTVDLIEQELRNLSLTHDVGDGSDG